MTRTDRPPTISFSVPIARLVPNPNNPRTRLGDLSELASRAGSIRPCAARGRSRVRLGSHGGV